MTFQHPELLWLLLLPPLMLAFEPEKARSFLHPRTELLRSLPVCGRSIPAAFLPWLKTASLVLAIAALARPQLSATTTTMRSRGIDMVLAIDLSSSMLAVDSQWGPGGRNRLALAKEVVRDFISKSGGDRIALVAFGSRPYPVSPLTTDHPWLDRAVDQLETGAIDDGTALGDAMLSALNRLRDSPAAGRTVIVLTDGRSNCGSVTPAAAAAVAAALKVKVHAIGIGGKGGAWLPVEDPVRGVTWRAVPADLDETVLREVAAATGGRYFQAGTAAALPGVFSEIERLEKRSIEEKKTAVKELFPPLLSGALALLMIERILSCTAFRRVP